MGGSAAVMFLGLVLVLVPPEIHQLLSGKLSSAEISVLVRSVVLVLDEEVPPFSSPPRMTFWIRTMNLFRTLCLVAVSS